jgi:hypothetical protein
MRRFFSYLLLIASGALFFAVRAPGLTTYRTAILSGVGKFVPTVRTYAAAGSFTETVPVGASQVIIEVYGGGGSGGVSSSGSSSIFGGAGGAGYSKKTLTLVRSDGGKTCAVVVAQLVSGINTGVSNQAGTTGNLSSVNTSNLANGSGTLIQANGGGAGPNGTTTGGAAGTATGGDTNTAGTAGNSGASNGHGGAGAGPSGSAGGGAGGAEAIDGTQPGGGGGGGSGLIDGLSGAGALGKVVFTYS